MNSWLRERKSALTNGGMIAGRFLAVPGPVSALSRGAGLTPGVPGADLAAVAVPGLPPASSPPSKGLMKNTRFLLFCFVFFLPLGGVATWEGFA